MICRRGNDPCLMIGCDCYAKAGPIQKPDYHVQTKDGSDLTITVVSQDEFLVRRNHIDIRKIREFEFKTFDNAMAFMRAQSIMLGGIVNDEEPAEVPQ